MRRRFRSRLVPTLAAVLLFPVFVALGYWQLQRAEEKRALQAEYDARAFDAELRVTPRLQRAADLRFYRVIAKGTYDLEYQLLLDNRVHHGVPGYYVITPLRVQGGDVRILVNRGWIPWGESRQPLPEFATPGGFQEITGIATVPLDRVFTLGAPVPLKNGPMTVWPYLDMQRYRAAVPFPVQPVVVLLAPDSKAGGFTREWNRLDVGITVHQGYAFQWFALAAAVLMIYLLLSRRGPTRADRGNDRGEGA